LPSDPSDHRPKWDEIFVHAGQGSKIHFYVSTAVIPDKHMRRNKASNIYPSKQVDASGNDVTCIQEILSLNSTVAQTILTDDFCGLPQSLQVMI
jgi:hypothetical protein